MDEYHHKTSFSYQAERIMRKKPKFIEHGELMNAPRKSKH